LFSTKQNLEKHLNKKFKCNITSNIQCETCKKYFTNKKNLYYHISNNSCKQLIKINDDESNDFIESILLAQLSNDMKVELLKIKGINLDDNKLNEIINSENELKVKKELIKCFYNKSNPSTINNNNMINLGTIENSNNVTNIQINNFGKEDISYLSNDYFKNLIMNQHIEKGYIQLIKDIYLNKEHPENGTIKVENINNKYAHVYNNGKWDTILKYDLREQMHKKNYTILKMHYDKLKKAMSLPKKEETYVFLARDELSDPHMMYVIDKIILLFYNEGEGDDMPDKYKIGKNTI
jgi:hypothetical protein